MTRYLGSSNFKHFFLKRVDIYVVSILNILFLKYFLQHLISGLIKTWHRLKKVEIKSTYNWVSVRMITGHNNTQVS